MHSPSGSGSDVERNVVYGTYSGLALLLDVHRPAQPNGFGVVLIDAIDAERIGAAGVYLAGTSSACWRASPLVHVNASAAPFLLLHGDADAVVPIRNSEALYAAGTLQPNRSPL